jgi:hypothetical protein
MQRLIDLNTKILADSTEYIEIESSGTIVSDPAHIYEFYQKCSGDICKAVRTRLDEINKDGTIPPMEVLCNSCNEPYSVPLVFDYASFFAAGS